MIMSPNVLIYNLLPRHNLPCSVSQCLFIFWSKLLTLLYHDSFVCTGGLSNITYVTIIFIHCQGFGTISSGSSKPSPCNISSQQRQPCTLDLFAEHCTVFKHTMCIFYRADTFPACTFLNTSKTLFLAYQKFLASFLTVAD
jgi:hypothetical protein